MHSREWSRFYRPQVGAGAACKARREEQVQVGNEFDEEVEACKQEGVFMVRWQQPVSDRAGRAALETLALD